MKLLFLALALAASPALAQSRIEARPLDRVADKNFAYRRAETMAAAPAVAVLPPAPTLGERLCDLLYQPIRPVSPDRQVRTKAPGAWIGVDRDAPVAKSSEPQLLMALLEPGEARVDVALQPEGGGRGATVLLTVELARPLVIAVDRAAVLTIEDEGGALVPFDAFTDPESDDRLCSQVKTVALAHLEPGAYRLHLRVAGQPTSAGVVAMHLPPPPPPVALPAAPAALAPPVDAPATDHESYAWALSRGHDLPAFDVARRERLPVARRLPDDEVPPTLRSSEIPCAYDVRFVSFTPRKAPAGDARGEFSFTFGVEGNPAERFDFSSSEVAVDQTMSVHGAMGTLLAPCGEPIEAALELGAREIDDWWIFGFAQPDEKATLHTSVGLECQPDAGDVVRTFTLQLANPAGTVKHAVDVVILFRPYNQALACDEIPAEGALSPCTFHLSVDSLKHIDGPGTDKRGEFEVVAKVPEGLGRKYPVNVSDSARVKRGERGSLDLDLESFTVPCGAVYEVPLTVQVLERDSVGSEFGALTKTVTLTCPPAQALGYQDVGMELDLAQDNGVVKHRVGVNARVRSTNADFCAPAPAEYACRFAFDGLDVTHTAAPGADERGEFRFTTDLGHGNGSTVLPSADGSMWVELDDTEARTYGLGTVEVPCGETVEPTMQITATELDIVTLWPTSWTITTAHEYGGTTVPLTLTCPPDEAAAAFSTSIELRNAKGNRQHDVDVVFRRTLANPEEACAVIPEPPPPATCDLELDFWSFAHLSSSTGDKDGRFVFAFTTDYLASAHGNSFREVGLFDVYRGYTKTMAYLVKHNAVNEVGASFGDFFRIPVGQTVPIGVRVDVDELDFWGDDHGWITTQIDLNCEMAATPFDAELPITIGGDKHHGVIRLRVQGH